MKEIDIFCASQASTAICMSMDIPSSSSSSSSSSAIHLGGRAIDRHNPIIRDPRRTPRGLPTVPCTSQPPPTNPAPYHQLHKSKKKGSANNKANDHHQSKKSSKRSNDQKARKSSSYEPIDDAKKSSTESPDIVTESWVKPGYFITPPGSSRYLLSDTAFFDGLPDYDPVFSPVSPEANKIQALDQDEPVDSKPSTSPRSDGPSNQVVVLRVSLHCRGCEGKVRKHLSRMEGVTSFTIDFPAKKVTIVGNVTPSSVLASVSKVKNAQFWTSSATPAAAGPNNTEQK